MATQLLDPVCRMSVTPASEHHYAWNNTDYYFCCSGCREKFAATASHQNPGLALLNPSLRRLHGGVERRNRSHVQHTRTDCALELIQERFFNCSTIKSRLATMMTAPASTSHCFRLP
ncbi:MAG TPA: YHS domain-containing protein [Gammaproteobacteria bacterium]|nr:YHS domain-containing protein [Gammaproteobacteria bacterium]